MLPESLLIGRRRDFDISILIDGTPVNVTAPNERRLLNLVVPPWQRQEVWSLAQKRLFIEGIFLGLGMGYYVTNGTDWGDDGACLPMSGWLLDGQQRLTAIRDFMQDVFPVFDRLLFSQLDRTTALKRFLRQPFPRFELDYTNDEDKLKMLYERLNFGGTAHTEQEHVQFNETPPLRPRN